jgi:hypothetical protein
MSFERANESGRLKVEGEPVDRRRLKRGGAVLLDQYARPVFFDLTIPQIRSMSLR